MRAATARLWRVIGNHLEADGMSYYLGIDLGGTSIKAGVVDAAGTLLAERSHATPRDGFASVVAAIHEVAERVVEDSGVDRQQVVAAGVGTPGLVDASRGVVRDAPNLVGFREAPLGPSLAEKLQCAVSIENDANAAAFGETWAGAGAAGRDGQHVTDLILLTLGTGVGGGIVSAGRVLHGCHGLAGEVGHMIVVKEGRPCGCGQRGCLEAYASASAVARRAEEAAMQGRWEKPSEGGEPIDAEAVFIAAAAGDLVAREIVSGAAEALGLACLNLCRVLDPRMIVLGGGMAAAGQPLLVAVRDVYRRLTWRLAAGSQVRFELAVLGNTAGMVGAAGIACNACGP